MLRGRAHARVLGCVAALTLAAPAVAKAAPAAPVAPAQASVGKPAPPLEALAPELAWKNLRDQVVVITFGASWCVPCKRELPVLDRLAAELVAAKKGRRVRIIAINIDDELEVGKGFVTGLGLRHLTVAYDPKGKVASVYKPAAMPTTFVVDGQGVLRHVHKGYTPGDERRLRAVIDRLR